MSVKLAGKTNRGSRRSKGVDLALAGNARSPDPGGGSDPKRTPRRCSKKLIELNDPRYIPAGFILAVMLERKRILKVKEQIVRDGKRTIIYEQPKTGDVLTITDPDLHLNQLEEVQRDVAHLLEHGLNPPQPAEAAIAQPASVIVNDAETTSPLTGRAG